MEHNIGLLLSKRARITANGEAFVEFERNRRSTFKELNQHEWDLNASSEKVNGCLISRLSDWDEKPSLVIKLKKVRHAQLQVGIWKRVIYPPNFEYHHRIIVDLPSKPTEKTAYTKPSKYPLFTVRYVIFIIHDIPYNPEFLRGNFPSISAEVAPSSSARLSNFVTLPLQLIHSSLLSNRLNKGTFM